MCFVLLSLLGLSPSSRKLNWPLALFTIAALQPHGASKRGESSLPFSSISSRNRALELTRTSRFPTDPTELASSLHRSSRSLPDGLQHQEKFHQEEELPFVSSLSSSRLSSLLGFDASTSGLLSSRVRSNSSLYLLTILTRADLTGLETDILLAFQGQHQLSVSSLTDPLDLSSLSFPLFLPSLVFQELPSSSPPFSNPERPPPTPSRSRTR